MPIYEYQCKDCGNEFEKLVGFSDPQVHSPECPECHSPNTRKCISTISSFSRGASHNSSTPSCGSSGGFT